MDAMGPSLVALSDEPASIERVYPTRRRIFRRRTWKQPFKLLRRYLVDRRENGQKATAERIRQRIVGQQVAGPRIAIYAHYAVSGHVSRMVELQLATYAAAGFSIIFVSMCRVLHEGDLERLKPLCHRIILRRSFGRDFGAWRDILLGGDLDTTQITELLLLNDSILGPMFPMEPIFSSMRRREGLWGLNNSLQGCNHLQSYLLFANGAAAIRALMGFLKKVQLSVDKERVIRRGELAVSAAVARQGVPVYAYFGLRTIERAIVDTAAYRTEIGLSIGMNALDFASEKNLDDTLAKALFHRQLISHPANPNHQFAEILVQEFGFPFIKSELVVANPTGMTFGADWTRMVPHDSLCPVDLMIEHLCLT